MCVWGGGVVDGCMLIQLSTTQDCVLIFMCSRPTAGENSKIPTHLNVYFISEGDSKLDIFKVYNYNLSLFHHVPWGKLVCSPVPQKSKIGFLYLVPQYCFVQIWSLFLYIMPCFPCSPKKPWEDLNFFPSFVC